MFNSLRNYLGRLKQRNKLICYWLVRLTGRPSRFTFRGQTYRCFWHRYNATWRNERAIEIPIARSFLAGIPPDQVLEIGNVLSHYGPVSHEVVDKYEQAEGVRNQDVCDLKSNKKYTLILSISTLEHVGWDEEPRDETKAPRAIENLQRLLAPGGRLVVTIPVGYNPPLDRMIADGRISFSWHAYLKRSPRRNQWREVSGAEVRNSEYDRQTNCAHVLFVGTVGNR
ncbi:MAG TPA: hypothetical protein VFQ24_18545 [Terriglobia bacterium]|nr:hypothetical protein [Terriglobia bacterium]